MNISYLLVNSAGKYPDKTAIISEDKVFSYKEFNARVNCLADAMRQHDLKAGDRVAIMFFNSHQFAEVYFAAIKSGAVATPVNFRFVADEIEYIINHSETDFFFFGKEFEETISSACRTLPAVKHFVCVDAQKDGFAHDYEMFLSYGKADENLVDAKENDPCQIMYTSGTTGKPKGAVITHGNILWNLHNTILGREDRSKEVSLIIGPMYHTAGLNNHFTIQIALGGTCILIKKFEPETVLRYIEEKSVNVISGAPSMFNILLQHPKLDDYNTSSITKCTSGAAILPVEVKKKLLKVFPNSNGVYDVYGCTEASPTITILKGNDSFRKHGSVGRAVNFLQARVVDEDGNSMPADQAGELICKGPNIMQEYYKDSKATKEAIKNGWLYTGDMATVDKEGYFYIVDRKKDMISSGGENIYPREIEEVLFGHPAIADAAVVGIPDAVWGETVKAFVVLKTGMTMSEQEVINYCKKHLASYKKPRAVSFVESIPKNPSGKVLKRLLKEL
ncbi:MAG: long-chain fatty acid--CoA ligase [Proteobacteria bacterium]|nr:long-chain fatty acid--CoA ligase [Pseudomonadota bacterium]